ncbi:MAG: hypothetical protein JXR53_02400 [Bacteroidales bacterium]|nr:hypothetical protein [Bacteroidales bacterium]
MKKALAFFVLGFILSQFSMGQFEGQYWLNGGHNRINSWHTNLALEQSWSHKNFTLSAGSELALVNAENTIFNALSLGVEQKFHIKDFKLQAFGSFQYRPFSTFIREKIYAVGLHRETPHWNLTLGNFTRVYTLSKEMQELYPDDDASNLKEWHNILYDFEYLIQERESDLVLSVGLSNRSDFLFQQATNFMIYCKVRKNILDHQVLFGEIRYQTAGSNNLQADYFGVIMKGGIIWKF